MKILETLALGIALSLLAPGCAETLSPSTEPGPDASVSAGDAPLVVDTAPDAPSPGDVPPAEDVPPVVPPDAGPACARRSVDLNAHATREGGFRVTAPASARSGIGRCQTWQGGGSDRWLRFVAPVAGLWRVSARGSNLWSFSAHRACEGTDTEVACRQFTDYHSPEPFSRPLTFDLELAAGETAWLLASGCLGGACSWSVEVAPPVTAEGRCRLNFSPGDCRDGWFCGEHAGLPSGVGRCVEATAPTLREASVFEWEQTLRVRVHGVDTSRDVRQVEVETFGADGGRLATSTGYLTVDGGDDFVGRAHVDPGARVRTVGVASVELTVVDRRGLRSAPLRVPVRPPVVAEPGQPCDPAGVDNVCPARHRCGTAEWGGRACIADR